MTPGIMPLDLTCLTAARPTVARGWADSFRGVAIEKEEQELRKGPGRWPLLVVLQLKSLQRTDAQAQTPIPAGSNAGNSLNSVAKGLPLPICGRFTSQTTNSPTRRCGCA